MPRELRELAAECAGADPDTVELVTIWTSRTATLRRFAAGGAEDIVVKSFGDADEATAYWRALQECASALSGAGHGRALEALGISADSRSVATRFVDGTKLEQRLAEGPDDPALLEAVEGCGAALAGYHATTEAASEDEAAAGREDFVERASLSWTDPHAALDRMSEQPIARRYGDYHPGHVLIEDDGRLRLLDPPLTPEFSFVQRDVAWFLDALRMLAWRPSGLGTVLAWRRALPVARRRFLAGYEAGAHGRLPLSSGWSGPPLAVFEEFLLRRRQANMRGRVGVLRAAYYAPFLWRGARQARAAARPLMETG